MVRAYLFDVLLQVLVFLVFVYWPFLSYTNAPGLFGGRGQMAMSVPCCHSFYGTACAFGLTWRPFTGSLFLSFLLVSFENRDPPANEGVRAICFKTCSSLALGQPACGSTVGCKPGHDSPWILSRAPTQSGGSRATTNLSTVGCILFEPIEGQLCQVLRHRRFCLSAAEYWARAV